MRKPTDREIIVEDFQSRSDWERDINQSKGGPYKGQPPVLDGGRRDKNICTLAMKHHPINTLRAEIINVTAAHFIIVAGHVTITIDRITGEGPGLYYMHREEVDRVHEMLEEKQNAANERREQDQTEEAIDPLRPSKHQVSRGDALFEEHRLQGLV